MAQWTTARAMRGAAALLLLGFAATPALADSVRTQSDQGFGRILFGFAPAANVKADLTSGVLTLSFDRKVAVDPASIAHGLPDYLGSGRADPGGAVFRFALSQHVRLHTSSAGGETAIDLEPDSFHGDAPDLVAPPEADARAVDVNKLPPLRVRAGAYANFSRLVFDWNRNVSYAVFPGAGHITIKFETMVRPDFTAFENVSPPWVKEAGWKIEGRATVIDFETDAQSRYHDFKDGTKVVLDVLAPKADAAAYRPPSDSGQTVAHPELVKAEPKSGLSAQAKVVADAAATLNAPAKPAPAAAAPQPAKPAVSSPPAQPPATAPANAQNPPSPPASTAAPIADTATAEALRTRQGIVVSFPGAGTVPAAVFMRGMTAWIVIDGAPKVDLLQLKSALGDFPSSVDVASGNGVTIVRLGTKQPEEIAAHAVGTNLNVEIAPHVALTPTAIAFLRSDEDPKHVALETLVPGATHSFSEIDPAAGDTLIIVPGALGRAVLDARHYAEFSILPTAAGLVVRPFTDDLNVSVSDNHVRLWRPQGLALSSAPQDAAPALAGLARSDDSAAYLDLAHWGDTHGASAYMTARRLRDFAARQRADDADHARLALAKFYLGNEFAAEALGLVELIQATDPSLQGDIQLQTMRGAANYMMGRYRDAHNDLAASVFDNDRHAAFWRGLAEAKLENWDAARKALAFAEPVFRRYPAQWQARARLAEADAALAQNAIETADADLARLPASLPPDLALEAQLLKGRLYAGESRSSEAHPIFAALAEGPNPQIAAQAIYADVDTGLADGSLTRKAAIAALERLRFRWRGDTLELKTLRRLGSLYFDEKRWREGLQTLKIASDDFPDDDLARRAQDEMRATFANLFLKGKADGMPPIQALSLFYDFIDLTPIGPDGDEMIRRMADRLVAVDLMGPAETLLHYQITKRLDGMARAQVATRLAMIDLMDHKPKDALETLRSTDVAGLPDDINHARVLLESRALAALKQWDQALDLIAVDEAPDTKKLRADIYWESGNWPLAGQSAEQLLGNSFADAPPLTLDDRRTAMRAAIAYSLAGDEASLDRLRSHFAAKMNAGPDASAFAVVTQNIDLQGVAFRDLAGKIASIDTLEDFMQDFKKRFDQPKTN